MPVARITRRLGIKIFEDFLGLLTSGGIIDGATASSKVGETVISSART